MMIVVGILLTLAQVTLRLTKLCVILALAIGGILATVLGAAIAWRWRRLRPDPPAPAL
jgi:hypothetical protein